MRTRWSGGAAVVGLALGAAVALAQTPEPATPGSQPTSEALSAEEVQKLLSGNTEVALVIKRGVPTGREYSAYYAPDGTYRVSEAANGLRNAGVWFVDPLGRLCFRPGGKEKTKCDVILREGDGYIRLRDGERRGRMTVREGNPFQL